MSDVTFADLPWLVSERPQRPKIQSFRKGFHIATLAYTALAGVVLLDTHPAIGPGCDKAPIHLAAVAPAPAPAAKVMVAPLPALPRALLDPTPTGGRVARLLADSTPLSAMFHVAPAAPPSVVVADVEPENDVAIPASAVASPLVADVPLPMPRPAEFGSSARLATLDPAPAVRAPFHATSRPPVRTGDATAAPDNRSFFEKLFGVRPSSGPALAYAAPEDGFFSGMRRAVGGPNPTAGYGANTAVYDIMAHTVYMPDGSRLEAHSGLRDRLDDPRFVHERMRGPTPPSTYDLKLREALFHGVQALRLTPVGGNVFGRTGLLAHTYMLGPNGDSNGCVSFRNYKAFLQAYMNGDVRRLVVVARLL